MPNELNNIIEKTYQNKLFNILEIINYSPPQYDSSWNKKFIKYNPSKRVPDKKQSKFDFDFKQSNPLNLNNDCLGVYLILSIPTNFAYVGCSNKNLKQRFETHIQKITATNLNRYYTPINWDTFIITRYEKLKDKSIFLTDLKLTFFNCFDFKEILQDTGNQEEELEAIIYYFFKKKLKDFNFLNTENSVSNKIFRDKYKNYW
tara:strand:- start:120 stop:728 length:609 start_codon:yes stop_codon:yes gene_type:complete